MNSLKFQTLTTINNNNNNNNNNKFDHGSIITTANKYIKATLYPHFWHALEILGNPYCFRLQAWARLLLQLNPL